MVKKKKYLTFLLTMFKANCLEKQSKTEKLITAPDLLEEKKAAALTQKRTFVHFGKPFKGVKYISS